MTLETEQYDPEKTHWVKVVIVSIEQPDSELILEQAYVGLNRQALKQDKVILNISHTVLTHPKMSQFTIAYIITAQVVSRSILERQQFQQRVNRN